MSLGVGARLGHYAVTAKLGEGGMGEVWRATDTQLNRDVALKILPEAFATDPDRLARFQREAQVLASLNHPGIAAIYGIEEQDDTRALVLELVEGPTVADRISKGPIPLDEALPIATQIAEALEAAHEAGVIHRDLKPANIKVREDGTVKVLDFGLAKALDPSPTGDPSQSPTLTAAATQMGVIMGTAAYMSPEQARGKPVDKRADIWAFGAVLFEMLTGRPLFEAADISEMLASVVLKEPDLSAVGPDTPVALQSLLRRCLVKDPKRRLRDIGEARLVFEIDRTEAEASGAHSRLASDTAGAGLPSQKVKRWRIAVALMALLVVAAYWLGQNIGAPADAPPVTYERLTFRQGRVYTAQFDPGSRDVIYTASWEGEQPQIYSTQIGTRVSRALGLEGADILSVSSRGEIAVLRKAAGLVTWDDLGPVAGTLALTTASSGAARELSEGVVFADWAMNGDDLVVVRRIDGRTQVEFPIGSVLYETTNVVSSPRASRDGEVIAFGEKAAGFARSWSLVFLALDGIATRFDTGFRGDKMDLAWSPDGSEVWFNMSQGGTRDLHAMSAAGERRTILRPPVALRILDVASDGRVLVARTNDRVGVMGVAPGDEAEREFSWLDGTEVDAISGDGKTLLLTEYGEGGGERWSVYLRRTDGSPAIRLGEGQAFDLSPDGEWALTMPQEPVSLVLLPTGAGTPVIVDNDTIVDFVTASFVSDANEVVFAGNQEGAPLRWFRQTVPDGIPQPITGPVGYFKGSAVLGSSPVSPDGTMIAAAHDGHIALYPLDGGEPRDLEEVPASAAVIRFTPDGRFLFFAEDGDRSINIYRVEITTGHRELWKILEADPVGLDDVYAAQVADDGESYYYTFQRQLSDLFLVQGLH